jgi:thymidylate synthase (FAD)
MSKVNLVWSTPDGENLIAYMARVSNPTNQNNKETSHKLIKYLISNKHWSPFEMVNVCMEIETTRDIARQMLRHRSFSFQEFSQRYAEVYDVGEISQVRLQDKTNRQNSIETDDEYLTNWWRYAQVGVADLAEKWYNEALAKGIAKEVARKILPEGITTSRLYMNGTLRSWIHYCSIRCSASTQKEHREVANKCRDVIIQTFPSIKDYV